MSSLGILAVGMAIVLVGVLAFRLHPFLTLILAALVVAALTSEYAVLTTALESRSLSVVSVDAATDTVTLAAAGKQGLVLGTRLVALRTDDSSRSVRHVATLAVRQIRTKGQAEGQETIATVVEDEASGTLRPSDWIMLPSDWRTAEQTARQSFGQRVAIGFARTCQGIGILIAMAAVIGKCLLESGAAQKIVASARKMLGERRTPLALVISGFVVGIPVFFDTVFYLLMPLGKAMRLRSGKNYTLYVLSIVIGATMAHSLVPPTPGPLLVANELDVDIGLMMLGGILVGLCTISCGYLYAVWANRRWNIPLRPTAEFTTEDLAVLADADAHRLPSIWLSLAPILLPVVLIAGRTVVDMTFQGVPLAQQPTWLTRARPAINAMGDKNVAMVIAAGVALGVLAWQRGAGRNALATTVQTALAGGGIIILITAAGGAFGHALRQTGIAAAIGRFVPEAQVGLLLPLAFLVTMIVRAAQGSATVAMITAVGIVAPLAARDNLPFHPVYVALAIGCGSKPLSWMNDSGFWVVGKMSGMTESETLKTFSAVLTVMGLAGLAVVCLGAWWIPLV